MVMRNAERLRLLLPALATLAVLAVAGAIVADLARHGTQGRIVANERRAALAVLHSVLPADTHDNDLLTDFIEVVDDEVLGSTRPHRVYRARRNGQPAGVVMEVTARGGYGGPLELLVGITAQGTVTGVRILVHHETPGIGDGVERKDWLSQFDGHSLTNPPPEDWQVKRDGGSFDQLTGATISPRAVVKGVYNALLYFREHQQELFAAPALL
jgi:H+/Na+-translocating ferredoxin:NAD+ oxidoreductase subunit G